MSSAETLLEQPVGKLARELPGSTGVFAEFGIDFCCGGQKSLADALKSAGAKPAVVVEALAALTARQNDDQRWEEQPDQELIDHILHRYHDVHREQLTELIRLAARVESVHGDNSACPRGLAQYLRGLKATLEQHMMKEEQILFPMLLRGQRAMAGGPIGMMRHEHDEHALAISGLAHLTNDMQPPKGACTTWRALYNGIDAFVTDLKQHIHLENNVLFERTATTTERSHSGCCGHCS